MEKRHEFSDSNAISTTEPIPSTSKSTPYEATPNQPQLEDWTKEEKLNLLQALQIHGSQDVTTLSYYVPTKSEDQIELALEFYRERSLKLPEPKENKRRGRGSRSPTEVLDSWAKLLTDSRKPDELRTDIAAALRLIAEFEDRPPSECTENVDFEKVYMTLADALDGKTLEEDNLVKAMIDKCVTDTALNSECSIRNAKFKELLGSVSLREKLIKSFPKPTNEKDLAQLRPIIADKSYNPLNVNEEHCKLLG